MIPLHLADHVWPLIGAATTAAVLYKIYSVLTNPTSKLPGPWYTKWTDWVLSYQWFYGQQTFYIHDLHQKYGPIVRVAPNQVDVADLDVVKTIYGAKEVFPKSVFYKNIVSQPVDSLFSTMNNDTHRKLRRLLAPQMSESSLKPIAPTVESHAELTICKMKDEEKAQGVIDVFKWSLFMATDVVGELAFGESFHMLQKGKKNQYIMDLEDVTIIASVRVSFPVLFRLAQKYAFLPLFKHATGCANRIKSYAVQSIKRYQDHLDSNPDQAKTTLFTKILKAKGDGALSFDQVVINAQSYITAGSDTTALTLTYFFWSVCRRPELRDALVNEVQGLPANFSDQHLRDLPLLNQTILETLRLHTASPVALPRSVPPSGLDVRGTRLGRGTVVSAQAYTMHRDPEIFPNPHEFNPHRWANPTKAMKDAFMPFGRGTKICIGLHLAEMEIRMLTARFLQEFPHARVSTRDGFSDEEMGVGIWFLLSPKGKRCLIEVASYKKTLKFPRDPIEPCQPNMELSPAIMASDEDVEIEVPELAADDPMRAFLPASFGKKSKDANIAAQIDRSKRTVESPPTKAAAVAKKTRDAERSSADGSPTDGSDDSADDDDDDSSSNSDEDDEFPVSHELVLKTHSRAVTTVSLDPSGGRLLTASLDCNVSLHDFASMTPSTLRAFKTVDPHETKKSAATAESHPVHHVEFNHLSGGVFLCVSAHPQAKIMSRDGQILTEFVKGDMYLRDMNNTKGHISEITTGTWHPTDKNLCITAGTDSTLRIWDINNKRSQREVVVFKSKAAGSAGRTKMTAVAWGSSSQGGNNVLVSAALDGTLVMYGGDGPFTRPAGEIRDAHKPQTWTSGIDISSDGRMVVTRGGDDLIKLWDTRKFTKPLVSVTHKSTADYFTTSNIRYAPNSTSIVTGSETGHLHILNPGNLRAEHVTPITPGSALITVNWHPKINQIVTGSANAETHVLYNPTMSSRGAVEVMSRAPKKRHIDDDPNRTMDQGLGMSGDSIIAPGALRQGSRKLGDASNRRSKDPRRPHIPQQTPFQKNQPDEKRIAENIPLARMLHEDPREALLKYADKAKNDPIFTKAWSKTQPQTQYADVSDQEDDEPDKKKVKR